jgi:hypothetical protein
MAVERRQYGFVDPQPVNILQPLFQLMELKQQMEAHGDESKERTRTQRIEKALQSAKGDPEAAAGILEKDHGDWTSARTLREKAGEIRTKSVDDFMGRMNEHKTVYGQAERALVETEANPALYPQVRSRLVDLASQLDPRLAQEIPEQYDPERVRAMLRFVRDGAATSETLASATESAKQAMAEGVETSKRDEYWRDALLKGLSRSESADVADTITQRLRSLGMPQSVADEFGPWTPESPAKASERLLTPEQRATAARATVDDTRLDANAEEQRRHNREMEVIGRQRETRLGTSETTGPTKRQLVIDLREPLMTAVLGGSDAPTLQRLQQGAERLGLTWDDELAVAKRDATRERLNTARAGQLLETVPRDPLTGRAQEDPDAARARRLGLADQILRGDEPDAADVVTRAEVQQLATMWSVVYAEAKRRVEAAGKRVIEE